MPIRNFFADTWTAVNTTGLVIMALVLMFGPFFISLIANIGRPAPKPSRIRRAGFRPARTVRTIPS